MMKRRLHADRALESVLADEIAERKGRRRNAAIGELTVADGATTRALARAAGRGARTSAVAVGTAGVLLAPGMSGLATAEEAPPAPDTTADAAPTAEPPTTDAPAAAPATDEPTAQPTAPAPAPATDEPTAQPTAPAADASAPVVPAPTTPQERPQQTTAESETGEPAAAETPEEASPPTPHHDWIEEAEEALTSPPDEGHAQGEEHADEADSVEEAQEPTGDDSTADVADAELPDEAADAPDAEEPTPGTTEDATSAGQDGPDQPSADPTTGDQVAEDDPAAVDDPVAVDAETAGDEPADDDGGSDGIEVDIDLDLDDDDVEDTTADAEAGQPVDIDIDLPTPVQPEPEPAQPAPPAPTPRPEPAPPAPTPRPEPAPRPAPAPATSAVTISPTGEDDAHEQLEPDDAAQAPTLDPDLDPPPPPPAVVLEVVDTADVAIVSAPPPDAVQQETIAVDPVFSPNDAPEVRVIQPAADAPAMLEERIGQSQSRPVDRQRVGDWSQAIRQAWQARQAGVDADELAAVSDALATAPTLGWSYAVEPGDSLWSIARALWGDAPVGREELEATVELLHAWNADHLGADPDVLDVGLVLQIPADIA